MKIVLVTNTLAFFLSHRRELAIFVAAKGHQVSVACAHPSGSFSRALSLDLCDTAIAGVLRAGVAFLDLPTVRRGASIGSLFKLFLTLSIIVRRERADVLHLTGMASVLVGTVLTLMPNSRQKVLISITGLGYTAIHIDRPLVSLAYAMFKWVMSRASRSGRHYVSVQNSEDYELMESLGWTSENLNLIGGQGVKIPKQNSKRVYKFCKLKILVVSRLLKDKGIHDLLEAYKLLKDREIALSLRVVGGIDPGNPSSLSQREFEYLRGIDPRVSFFGHERDLEQHYRWANLFCLPSHREGFPRVIQEAGAHGLPIITTDVAGCRDAIVNGKTGWLFQPRDPISLANLIEGLSKNFEILAEASENSYNYAKLNFNRMSLLNKIYDTYLLINGNRRY